MDKENIRGKIEKLDCYRKNLIKISSLQNEILEINELLYSPRHSSLSFTRVSGYKQSYADSYLDRKKVKIDKLKKMITDSEQIICDIEDAIFEVEDVELRNILSKRFILGESVVSIAEEYSYSVRHIYRKIEKGAELVRI